MGGQLQPRAHDLKQLAGSRGGTKNTHTVHLCSRLPSCSGWSTTPSEEWEMNTALIPVTSA